VPKGGEAMSIFRLDASEFARFDSRYIDCIDLVIQNPGRTIYQILIHGWQEGNRIHTSLHQVNTVPMLHSTININNIRTNHAPFRLEVITNVDDPDATVLVAYAKNGGNLVAVLRESDFVSTDS